MPGRHPRSLSDLITAYGLTSGVANIIMQLSSPPVGYGVHESRVVSGSPRRHPIKRTRTTSQYLAVAVLGDDADRDRMRAEVADVHKAVISSPDSPVKYSGNSPNLQKWVAACLFRFYLDQYTTLYGPLPTPNLDELTRSASTLATTLNVRKSAWPQTWAEFETYWNEMLPSLSIDDPIRQDFESLSNLEFLTEAWGPLAKAFPILGGPHYSFMTRANLPPVFRAMMGWSWSAADERRLARARMFYRSFDRVGGGRLVRLGYQVAVMDFRVRACIGDRALGPVRVSGVAIKDGGGARRLAGR